MNREGCHLTLTRRGVLTLAGGAGIAAWSRLYGSNSDFWNKKEPAEWTSAEVDQMITEIALGQGDQRAVFARQKRWRRPG